MQRRDIFQIRSTGMVSAKTLRRENL